VTSWIVYTRIIEHKDLSIIDKSMCHSYSIQVHKDPKGYFLGACISIT